MNINYNFKEAADEQRLIGQENATLAEYRKLTKLEHLRLIHSYHHASSNLANPLASALLLGDGKLTLADLLSPNWEIKHIVEIFLSCCETNLGTPNINDDILTLSAGFLRAGAQTVVSTLWSVNAFATAILCLFYYQKRQTGLNRALSLQTSQQDLRQLTGDELKTSQFYQVVSDKIDEIWEKAEEKVNELQENLTNLPESSSDYQSLQNELTQWNNMVTACQQMSDNLEEYVTKTNPFDHPKYWSAFVCQGVA